MLLLGLRSLGLSFCICWRRSVVTLWLLWILLALGARFMLGRLIALGLPRTSRAAPCWGSYSLRGLDAVSTYSSDVGFEVSHGGQVVLLLGVGVGRGHHVPGDGAVHERTGHALHVEAKLQGVSELRPTRGVLVLATVVRVGHIIEALHASVVGDVRVHVRESRKVVKLA